VLLDILHSLRSFFLTAVVRQLLDSLQGALSPETQASECVVAFTLGIAVEQYAPCFFNFQGTLYRGQLCPPYARRSKSLEVLSLYLKGISTGEMSVAHQPPAAVARMTKLVLTFPDSETGQQFSGWLDLEGYTDRVLDQNNEEAESRNGRVGRE
jgi:hypothetical protein